MKKVPYHKLGALLWAALIALGSTLSPHAAQAETTAPTPEPSDEIVYIDAAGFIRVIDLRFDGVPEIQWVSPEAGWDGVALGDVNNDGDKEIVAIRGDGTEAKPGILAVYDPVLNTGTIADGKINGIPWAKLWEVDLGYKPIIVASGNFDNGVPGDQIIVGGNQSDPTDAKKIYRVTLWKQTSQTPNGKEWAIHQDRYFEEQWDRVAWGDFVPGGADEIGLVDTKTDLPSGGKMGIYQIDNNWRKLWDYGDSRRPARDVVFGQWKGSSQMEVATTRDPSAGQASLYVLEWSESEEDVVEDTALVFDPAPRRIAMGNTNGANNDEIFALRTVPAGVDLARLFNITRGGDSGSTHVWNNKLADSNNWGAIVMGDVDNDGRAELIMGNRADEKIRVYWSPESNDTDFRDISTTFNNRTLVVGNLDAIGFTEGPMFAVDKESLEAQIPSGGSVAVNLALRNSATAESVPFSTSFEANPAWISATPSSGNLPANGAVQNIRVNFNAADLAPGIYRSRLFIDSTANVINKPLNLVVTFTVLPAQLTATPNALFASMPVSPTESVTQTMTIKLGGTSGTAYTAAILAAPAVAAASEQLGGAIVASELNDAGALVLRNADGASVEVPLPQVIRSAEATAESWPSGVAWATLTSGKTSIPDTLTVTFDPNQVEGDFDQAMIFIYPDDSAGTPPESLHLIPLYILRTASTNYIPSVTRE